MTANGSGVHIDALPPNQIETWLKVCPQQRSLAYMKLFMLTTKAILRFYVPLSLRWDGCPDQPLGILHANIHKR